MTHSSCGAISSSLSHHTTHKFPLLVCACLLFLGGQASAQTSDATQSPASAQESAAPPSITIPAGTRFTLVLTNSVNSRETHTGDQIFMQVTAPVILGDEVAIPAGTFLQGKVQKLTRHGTKAEMLMQSSSLVFPNGYIARLSAPLNIESEEWTAWNNPGPGTKAGIIAAPIVGLGLGALIGEAAHTTTTQTLGNTSITSRSGKGVGIGSIVGLAAGGVVSLVLMARSHGFYLEEGSPLSMALPHPITLTQIAPGQTQNAPPPPSNQTRPPTDEVRER